MKDDAATPAPRASQPTLDDALADAMAVDVQHAEHAQRLFRLSVALSGATGGALTFAKPNLAGAVHGPADPQLSDLAAKALDEDEGRLRHKDRLALRFGAGEDAFAIALRITGGQAVLAVGWERLTFLATLSAQRGRIAARGFDNALWKSAAVLAAGEWSAAQSFADDLRLAAGADGVIVGAFEDRLLASMVVSDAPALARVGSADDDLRERMAALGAGAADEIGIRLGSAPDGYGVILIGAEKPEEIWAALRPVFALPRARRPIRSRLRRYRAPLIATVAVAAIACLPIPDSVEAPATVVPDIRRTVTAPMSARLMAIEVSEGEQVKAGDKLAAFDMRDLDLGLSEARARLAAALTSLQDARARRDEVRRRDAELEMSQIDARIDQLEAQRETAILYAPIDGIIARDFADRRVGSHFSVGEAVLEVFSQGDVRLEALINERDRAHVTVGDEALFRSDADPDVKIPATIDYIAVVAEEREGFNVFRIDMTPKSPLDASPGMKGVAAYHHQWRMTGLIVWDNIKALLARRFWI